jgi:hypothetical protein
VAAAALAGLLYLFFFLPSPDALLVAPPPRLS